MVHTQSRCQQAGQTGFIGATRQVWLGQLDARDEGADLHRPEVHLCAVEPRRAADGSGSRTVQNGPLSKVSSP